MRNPLNELDITRDEWEEHIFQNIVDKTDREMLRLRLLDGLTIQEVAEEIDLSLDQTKKRLYRAQARLFKKIK